MKKLITVIMVLFLVNGAMAQWYNANPNDDAMYKDVIYFTDANTGFVTRAAQTNFPPSQDTIWKTFDGGLNWIPQYASEQSVVAIFFPDSSTGYAIEQTGGIYSGFHYKVLKTSGGGSHWSPTTLDTADILNAIFFTDTSTGYAVGQKIFKTSDGGLNWIMQYDGQGVILNSVFFIDSNTGYAAGSTNQYFRKILKTTDGGLNWISVLDEFGYELNSVFFTGADTGYAAGRNVFLKTTDGGTNWMNLSSATNWRSFYKQSLFFTAASTGYAIGEDINSVTSILKTTDGGESWNVQSVNQPNNFSRIYSVFFSGNDTGYITSDYGILRTDNGGGFPAGTDEQSLISKNLSVYPSPTSSAINLEIPEAGFLSILNLNGHELMQQQVMEKKLTIDVSELPDGVYFVRITGEKGVSTGKFIRQ